MLRTGGVKLFFTADNGIIGIHETPIPTINLLLLVTG